MVDKKRKGIKYIEKDNKIYSIIISANFSSENESIEFFTPGDFSHQLGFMHRPKDYIIEPHLHNKVHREVNLTNEVLFNINLSNAY